MCYIIVTVFSFAVLPLPHDDKDGAHERALFRSHLAAPRLRDARAAQGPVLMCRSAPLFGRDNGNLSKLDACMIAL